MPWLAISLYLANWGVLTHDLLLFLRPIAS
jgi:hypothetical protein